MALGEAARALLPQSSEVVQAWRGLARPKKATRCQQWGVWLPLIQFLASRLLQLCRVEHQPWMVRSLRPLLRPEAGPQPGRGGSVRRGKSVSAGVKLQRNRDDLFSWISAPF